MSSPVPPNENQLSPLPGTTTYITGHNAEGKAIVAAKRPAEWTKFDDDKMAFRQIYTSSFPADLNGDKDLKEDEDLINSGKLGLVNKNGTVCRQVDFAPGYECIMHRTQSLDYGLVLEGTVEMILDDGNVTLMHRGDVAVQRGTIHAWRNASKTEWARMHFILLDIRPLTINGKTLGEDLGPGVQDLPPSGNDSS